MDDEHMNEPMDAPMDDAAEPMISCPLCRCVTDYIQSYHFLLEEQCDAWERMPERMGRNNPDWDWCRPWGIVYQLVEPLQFRTFVEYYMFPSILSCNIEFVFFEIQFQGSTRQGYTSLENILDRTNIW